MSETLTGWKQIAGALGCSERTAMRLAKEADDPLPVVRTKWQGICANRAKVVEWMRRNTTAYTQEIESAVDGVVALKRVS